MDKRDYFIQALHGGAVKKRDWVNSVFSVIRETTKEHHYDYQVRIRENGRYFNNPANDHELEPIEGGADTDQPLYRFREECVLYPGELANYQGEQPLRTTYGNVLTNYLLLVLPFGATIPFQAGTFNIGKVEDEILPRLTDDPEDDDVSDPPEGLIYCRQYLQFCDYALSLVAYANISVTSVSPKSLRSHPDARKRRDELKAEYQGRLSDPAVIAKIGDELEALDREWLKDDPTYDYYSVKDKKNFGAVRKKLFYLFGGESAFTDGSTMEFIEKSLEEGIDPEKLPAMINSLRYGSYNRGAQTQLGGESTKTIYRMLGTVRIAEEECDTHLGLPVTLTERDVGKMVGFWILDGKTPVLLDPDNIQQYVGREVALRSPMTCKTEGRNVCRRCVGEALAEQPDGIPAAAAGLGGRFLSLFLAKMHSGALKTTKWDRHARIQ